MTLLERCREIDAMNPGHEHLVACASMYGVLRNLLILIEDTLAELAPDTEIVEELLLIELHHKACEAEAMAVRKWKWCDGVTLMKLRLATDVAEAALKAWRERKK